MRGTVPGITPDITPPGAPASRGDGALPGRLTLPQELIRFRFAWLAADRRTSERTDAHRPSRARRCRGVPRLDAVRRGAACPVGLRRRGPRVLRVRPVRQPEHDAHRELCVDRARSALMNSPWIAWTGRASERRGLFLIVALDTRHTSLGERCCPLRCLRYVKQPLGAVCALIQQRC